MRCGRRALRANLRPVKLRSVTRLVLPFCRGLRRGKENNRVIRQDVGALKYVGVNVMLVDAGETISAALRAVGAREIASLIPVVPVCVAEDLN